MQSPSTPITPLNEVMSTNSPAYKKSSTIIVATLKRQKSGRYKIEAVDGAERKHQKFMWSFFHELTQTSHDKRGLEREKIKDILRNIFPDGKYRVYYNSIISAKIKPRKLFT
tara:strand:+ start:75 stop:410 length:336 start_codon:yes stop_codon:yes gene_type:complete